MIDYRKICEEDLFKMSTESIVHKITKDKTCDKRLTNIAKRYDELHRLADSTETDEEFELFTELDNQAEEILLMLGGLTYDELEEMRTGGEAPMDADKDKKLVAIETIIIFDGKLTASEFDSKATEYRHHILDDDMLFHEKIPATIYDIEKIGLKKLAYKIKGTETGWYIKFTYKTLPEKIPQLEKFFREDDTVIKYLSMKLTEDEAELLDDEKTISEQPEECHQDSKTTPKEIDAFDLIFGES